MTNSADGTVSVIDTKTNAVVRTVGVAGEPVDVAVTPDGTRAYVANKGTNTVAVLDTATNAQIGTIVVGKEPAGIAIAPGGAYAYVSNFGDESVSLISTATNSVPIGPIPVGKEPQGVAISPDSRFAYVALKSGGIAVLDTGTNSLVGSVPDPFGPSRIAIGPRGGRGFVTDGAATSVTAFNPATRALVGAPILTGKEPAGIAIAPDGKVAYVASSTEGSVTPIDTTQDVALSAPIGGFPGATGVAVKPDGKQGYVTDGSGSSVTVLDTAGNAPAGSIGVGTKPTGVAVAPNQGPRASFWISPDLKRAKTQLTLHAAGSVDPDGQIVNYAWDFGDGGHVQGPASTRVHRYRKPGQYLVTLTVTDEEGCSSELVYTGQTASCNGSAAATMSSLIAVVDTRGPVLRLRGPKRQVAESWVRVLAGCPQKACTLTARGSVTTVVEDGGAKKRSRHRLRTARSGLARGWHRMRLRIPRTTRVAALRALRQGGKATANLAVIAQDEAGTQTLRRVAITLVPPGRRR